MSSAARRRLAFGPVAPGSIRRRRHPGSHQPPGLWIGARRVLVPIKARIRDVARSLGAAIRGASSRRPTPLPPSRRRITGSHARPPRTWRKTATHDDQARAPTARAPAPATRSRRTPPPSRRRRPRCCRSCVSEAARREVDLVASRDHGQCDRPRQRGTSTEPVPHGESPALPVPGPPLPPDPPPLPPDPAGDRRGGRAGLTRVGSGLGVVGLGGLGRSGRGVATGRRRRSRSRSRRRLGRRLRTRRRSRRGSTADWSAPSVAR